MFNVQNKFTNSQFKMLLPKLGKINRLEQVQIELLWPKCKISRPFLEYSLYEAKLSCLVLSCQTKNGVNFNTNLLTADSG